MCHCLQSGAHIVQTDHVSKDIAIDATPGLYALAYDLSKRLSSSSIAPIHGDEPKSSYAEDRESLPRYVNTDKEDSPAFRGALFNIQRRQFTWPEKPEETVSSCRRVIV